LPTFGRDLGNGFVAGNMLSNPTTGAEYYRAVFDTLLLFPEEGTDVDLPDRKITVSTLDGVLIPAGVTLKCKLPSRYLFISRDLGERYSSKVEKVVHLATSEVLDKASNSRPASDFLGAVPEQKLSGITEVSEGSIVGMWNSTPYARRASAHPRYEFMFLQQGGLAALSNRFGAGDLFFVPKSALVGFEAGGPVRKIFWALQ